VPQQNAIQDDSLLLKVNEYLIPSIDEPDNTIAREPWEQVSQSGILEDDMQMYINNLSSHEDIIIPEEFTNTEGIDLPDRDPISTKGAEPLQQVTQSGIQEDDIQMYIIILPHMTI